MLDSQPNAANLSAATLASERFANGLALDEDRESETLIPYNFVMSPAQIFEGPTLIAPFSEDRSRWIGIEDGLQYISVDDGKLFRICKRGEEHLLIWTPELIKAKKHSVQYLLSTELRHLGQVFHDYVDHPEPKSLGPDGSACEAATRGLLRRRSIHAAGPFGLIGKEIDRHTQDDANVLSEAKVLSYEGSQGASRFLAPT